MLIVQMEGYDALVLDSDLVAQHGHVVSNRTRPWYDSALNAALI